MNPNKLRRCKASRPGVVLSTTWLAALAASIFLFVVVRPATAADDRFDRTKFDGRGGFAPVSDDVYRKECGSCHFAYLPGLLPARSWDRVMEGVGTHFGETLDLGGDVAGRLRAYLMSNAADRVPDLGPAVLLERLEPDKTPLRITQVPIMHRNHIVIREVFKVNGQVRTRTITNCDACHRNAAEGSFALRDLVVPGLSKMVRPGGAF